MITIKNFMESVNFRITEGSNYTWTCFGPNVYSLDSWNGSHSGHSVCLNFDTVTQEVYSMETCDYKNNRAYRLINPKYAQAYLNEARARGVEHNNAWDDEEMVRYVDLENDEDMLAKTRAIVAGEDYDTRVSIPLDMPDKDLLELFKLAHAADVSLNAFVDQVLRKFINEQD